MTCDRMRVVADEHFETGHIRNAPARFPELLVEELDVLRYTLVG